MNEIIKIEARGISGVTVQTCNARDLWQFVESKTQFSDWIKSKIEKYGFVEGEDYLVHKILNNPLGGRPTLDYHRTIETAKELAMVEHNDKGRQIRHYFIECEKRAKEASAFDPKNLSRMQLMQIAMQAEQERLQLEHKVEELAPKAQALDDISAEKGTLTLTEIAKVLNMKRKDLIASLHARGWIYRQNGSWVAYDQHIKAVVFNTKKPLIPMKKLDRSAESPIATSHQKV